MLIIRTVYLGTTIRNWKITILYLSILVHLLISTHTHTQYNNNLKLENHNTVFEYPGGFVDNYIYTHIQKYSLQCNYADYWSLPLPGIEQKFLGHPASSLVAILVPVENFKN
jgi:hypothetical protein